MATPAPDADAPTGSGGAHGNWRERLPDVPRGGESYAELIEAVRLLQDRLCAADVPETVMAQVASRLRDIAALLAEYEVPEAKAPIGLRFDLPGRGHPLLPPFVVTEWTDDLLRADVVFGRYYLGGNGAAHGGSIPLLFDEVLGILANTAGPVARTAYLTTNYRHITRIGAPLRVEATVDKREGRKRYVAGRIYDGDVVVSDAEALFVELRPGQP
jgi:acyl-coenzyme A thioesterase PaaI-like protein